MHRADKYGGQLSEVARTSNNELIYLELREAENQTLHLP